MLLPTPRYQWIILYVLIALASMIAVGKYGILDNNEGLYAEIAQEMIESGNWAMPHLNYVPYVERPPLLYWSTATSMFIFGKHEWAVLSKGIMAFALAGIIGIASIFILRVPLREAIRIFSLTGITSFLVIILPWHIIMMMMSDPGFTWWYFVNETVIRFFDQRIPKDYYTGPFYYYIMRMPLYLWVWTAFLPLFVFSRTREFNPLRAFLWVWFLSMLIFFSASQAKANYYMITGIPAIAILLALSMDKLMAGAEKRPFVIAASIMSVMNIILVLAVTIVLMKRPHMLRLIQGHGVIMLPAGFLMSAGTSYALLSAFKGRYSTVIAMGAALGCAPLFIAADILPSFDDHISQRQAAQWILSHPDGSVVLYADYEDMSSLQFYLARKLPIVDSRSDDLLYGEKVSHDHSVFITSSDLHKMAEEKTVYLVSCNKRMDTSIYESKDHFRIRAAFPKVTILSSR